MVPPAASCTFMITGLRRASLAPWGPEPAAPTAPIRSRIPRETCSSSPWPAAAAARPWPTSPARPKSGLAATKRRVRYDPGQPRRALPLAVASSAFVKPLAAPRGESICPDSPHLSPHTTGSGVVWKMSGNENATWSAEIWSSFPSCG